MKWAIILFGLVAVWLVNTWYLLILAGVLHSWWTLMPTMGWHTSAVVSGLVVVAVVAGQFITGFTSGVIKGLRLYCQHPPASVPGGAAATSKGSHVQLSGVGQVPQPPFLHCVSKVEDMLFCGEDYFPWVVCVADCEYIVPVGGCDFESVAGIVYGHPFTFDDGMFHCVFLSLSVRTTTTLVWWGWTVNPLPESNFD